MLIAAFSLLLGTSLLPAQAAELDPRCYSTRAGSLVQVGARRLVVAPDLPETIRDLSARLDVPGCHASVIDQMARFRAMHPEEYRVAFIEARALWRMGSPEAARALLQPIVEEHPDFASGQLLLGAIAVATAQFEEAKKHLDLARELSPDDLWAYVNALQLKLRMGQRQHAAELATVATHPGMPRTARESAALTIATEPMHPAELRVRVLTDMLTYETTAPRYRVLAMLGRILSEDLKQHDAARARLMEALALEDNPDLRLVLAVTYLDEASTTRRPERRQALIDEAGTRFGGASELAAAIARTPYYANRAELVQATSLGPNEVDRYGGTTLCTAAYELDIATVRAELARGANPDQVCEERSALSLAYGQASPPQRRLPVMRVLLEGGADPNGRYGSGRVLTECESDPAMCPAEMRMLLRGFIKPATMDAAAPAPVARGPAPPDPPICAAIRDRDLPTVRVELESDETTVVQALCSRTDVVSYAIDRHIRDPAGLREVLTLLVEHGAEVTPHMLDRCRSNEVCRIHVPILERARQPENQVIMFR